MNTSQGRTLVPHTALVPGPDLNPWDTNLAVAEAQDLLRAHGFDIPVNGDFDWKTENAVKSYQRKYDLRVDGIVGMETWISLKRTVPPGVRALQVGRSGADVFELQGLLQIAGYRLKRDGVFGEETQRAVIAFQQQHRLQANGTVNPMTWALLGVRASLLKQS
ncbi:peptidoglycan-binding protein [filamentous cyanobacterium CCP1]|jgi:peptidoglycan hydrolase-like protein with peptidoglycan-binding domain|nr:peptidoglycan-binding protein [filamentous cyanobacterium CCP2]PSB68377.1 peptidoglycan-binding protein [filamentous cyanobacterium CCP1]